MQAERRAPFPCECGEGQARSAGVGVRGSTATVAFIGLWGATNPFPRKRKWVLHFQPIFKLI